MLSFLIPTYNYDVTELVHSLFRQGTALEKRLGGSFEFEIIVADDASPNQEKVDVNRKITQWENCRYLPLQKNLGRAQIRNFLAGCARYEHLVFIDGDALLCTPDFVELCWKYRCAADVVCGTLRNPAVCPPGGELRYRYEQGASKMRLVALRNQSPYTSFSTFNVMFNRCVFRKLQFDRRCVDYGYEDALMGLMLKHYGFSVIHVDNPLIHNGIDDNEVYLQKVEKSLQVLCRLGEPLHSASALVCAQRRLRELGLLRLLEWCYKMFRKPVRANLLGQHPSMLLFKLYKMGYYTEFGHGNDR